MPRLLTSWLDSYLEYSKFSEAPDTFHYWTGVSAIAGALRRHVWVDMGYFQWTPCFYIVFVAPPGIVSKSTTANIGMSLLREVPGIQFGPDVVTWQSLIQSLAQSTEGFEYQNEIYSMSTVTIVSSEFGTFLNPNDREMVDVLVSLWDGQTGTFHKATKTSGSDAIVNPWINLIACTTPAWIQGNFPEYMVGGGFTSRTIFIYAEEKRQLVAYPGKELPPEYAERKRELIHDLEYISTRLIGPYTLTPAATRWGTQWYEKLYEDNRDTLATNRFAGYIARKQTHMHKLAMVIAASYKDTLELDIPDLEEADRQLRISEVSQQQVFSRIVSEESKAANSIVQAILRLRSISRRDLYLRLFHEMSFQQFNDGVSACIAAGLISERVRGNDSILTYLEQSK